MKRTILQKAAAAALFVLLTAALLAAADFLLVDDIHSYSRVMLQELYADAGNIDTLFLGSSHCYRSVDPAQVDAALGTHSFNAGSSQQLPDGLPAVGLGDGMGQNTHGRHLLLLLNEISIAEFMGIWYTNFTKRESEGFLWHPRYTSPTCGPTCMKISSRS